MCTTYQGSLEILHNNEYMFNKVKILIYDLLCFGNNESSKSRLESFPSNHYISTVYFTQDEVDFLLKFPSSTGLLTFAQSIELMNSEKKRSFEICSSHDIAPMMMGFFGVKKGFKNEKVFKNALKAFEKKWKCRELLFCKSRINRE